MRKLIIVAVALLGAATVASAAPRQISQCQSWGCGANGTQLDGIQFEDARAGGTPTVVTLSSGEVLGVALLAAPTIVNAAPRLNADAASSTL